MIKDCSVTSTEQTDAVVYVIANSSCEPASDGLAVTLTIFKGSIFATTVEHVQTTFEDFGRTTVLHIPGFGRREVTLFRQGQWHKISNEGSWAPRDGAGLLVKDGKAFLLGGWLHGPMTNEVWVSENLRDWTFLGFAPWEGRHGAAWLVHKNRLYVIGGDLFADVWSSSDGIDWRQEAADAPFGGRYTPNAVSLGGKLIVYAGLHWDPVDWCIESPECGVVGNNDVWESKDDGRTWTITTAAAPWEGRGLIHGSILFRDEIYLIGGGLKAVFGPPLYAQTIAEYSDIWTSRDGRTWEQKLSQVSFAPRTHFSVLATPHGCYVSDGSIEIQVQVSNDLFYARDCINYEPIADPPLQRRHASSVAYFNGTVVILGGPPPGGALTDVWQYVPEVASE